MKTWLIHLWIGLVAFVSPLFPLAILVSTLIGTDFVFGIYRAYKTKQEINSRKMGHTISKLFLYNLAVLSVFMLEKLVFGTDVQFTKVVVGVIAMVELKSIDESFRILYGFSIYESLIDKIKRGTNENKTPKL
jgi:Bacteriophage holin family